MTNHDQFIGMFFIPFGHVSVFINGGSHRDLQDQNRLWINGNDFFTDLVKNLPVIFAVSQRRKVYTAHPILVDPGIAGIDQPAFGTLAPEMVECLCFTIRFQQRNIVGAVIYSAPGKCRFAVSGHPVDVFRRSAADVTVFG